MTNRRSFLLASLAAPFAARNAFAAEAFPTQRVTIVVASTPGTVMDATARILGTYLEPIWKQTIVVVNNPGAGGAIGTEQVAKSKPDGHTLLIAHEGILVIQPLIAKATAPRNDIRSVVPLDEIELLFVVNRASGIKNLAELVAEAKKRPGKLSYASAGVGTPVHLRTEIVKQRLGIDLVHVPYKSVAAGMTDLLGGQIDCMLVGASTALPHIKDKLNVLATCGAKRNPLLPDVPSLSESYPGLAFTTWFALFAPADTPREVADLIARDVTAALRSPEISKSLTSKGIIPTGGTPEDLDKIVQRDFAEYSRVIKAANLNLS